MKIIISLAILALAINAVQDIDVTAVSWVVDATSKECKTLSITATTAAVPAADDIGFFWWATCSKATTTTSTTDCTYAVYKGVFTSATALGYTNAAVTTPTTASAATGLAASTGVTVTVDTTTPYTAHMIVITTSAVSGKFYYWKEDINTGATSVAASTDWAAVATTACTFTNSTASATSILSAAAVISLF